MLRYAMRRDANGTPVLEVPYRGATLLRQPLYTKGTAFSREEREWFELEGLLPHAVSSLEQQAERVYANVTRKPDALERYIGLASLQDRNETLFYRVLLDHLEEFLPIVYTPTVGKACQEFSHIFRRARGLWITPGHRDRIRDVLHCAPFDDVRLIVVTDNERILGLGDQGAGGMGIPIGKLALYTAAAGIPPWQTLPMSLDVGTDNRGLLEDPLYLGWRQPRLRGEAYDSLVAEFVEAVRSRFPRALLQWEDFKKGNAFRLLERYRRTLPSFNDDIQGTAAVAVAGMLASERLTGRRLEDERVVILGAGAAGIGIARLIRDTMLRAGMGAAEAPRRIAVLDSHGLLVEGHGQPDHYKSEFVWSADLARSYGIDPEHADLLQVVAAVKPSVLLGTSCQPGAFTEPVIKALAAGVDRPLVFPMSNPTSQSEAQPADVLRWTAGRALVATGSPFPPVTHEGHQVRIGQANNAFIFPGMGLGCVLSGVREVPDSFFAAAAEALAAEVSAEDLAAGSLYPRAGELRRVTARVAAAVVRTAREEGLGRNLEDDEIPQAVAEAMWEPRYPRLVPARELEPALG
jgi:malic enzyme